jgi:predicted nucleic acid-binding Zn ribbon protein
MKYKFECIQCGATEEKEIAISEYDEQKEKQTCSRCCGSMKRVIEWSGIAEGSGAGWYGKNGSNVI